MEAAAAERRSTTSIIPVISKAKPSLVLWVMIRLERRGLYLKLEYAKARESDQSPDKTYISHNASGVNGPTVTVRAAMLRHGKTRCDNRASRRYSDLV